MAEVKIGIIEIDKYRISLPEALKDSRVAEKFISAYFENMSKIRIEEEKTKQLEQQYKAEKVKRVFYGVGIVGIVAFVVYCICFSETKKEETKDVNSSYQMYCECNCSHGK